VHKLIYQAALRPAAAWRCDGGGLPGAASRHGRVGRDVDRANLQVRAVKLSLMPATPRELGAPRPVALVYRGPASLPGCPEAVAALLAHPALSFDVHYVGPREELKLTPATLTTTSVYAQPGGGTLGRAYRRMRKHSSLIQDYVRDGGRYRGFCLCGYLAGATPGFKLLPGDTDQYITSPGASVRTEKDTTISVTWRGRQRTLYFQDGPYFLLDENAQNANILATYPNGTIAALVTPFGRGAVAVTGPHPEATADWYESEGLMNPDGIRADLGIDLIQTLMRCTA
jgi:glutamine amidotransferase-like uncharacterized protein